MMKQLHNKNLYQIIWNTTKNWILCDSNNEPMIDQLRGDYFVSLNDNSDEYLSQCLNQYPSHPDEQYLLLNNFETKRVGRLQITTIEGEGIEDSLYQHVCGIGMICVYVFCYTVICISQRPLFKNTL